MKSFKQMTELDNSTVMIVDSLNLGFRWYHAKKFQFVEDYMATVDSLRRSYNAGKLVIAADHGGSSYRKNLYPEYKLNRAEKRETQTEQERENFEMFFAEWENTLEIYMEQGEHPVFRFPKVEADDIAAYIVKHRKRLGIKRIILVSSDRDWDLLICEDVIRFSYVTRKETTLENWSSHYDCAPEDYITIKCLQGDPGDNVPGVDKVGPVKAASLVREYGTIYDIAASLPINSKYVYIKNLNAFGADNLLRNVQLMDLLEYCEEALGSENCSVIDEELEQYLNVC